MKGAVLAVGLLMAGPAWGENLTGNSLHSTCSDSDNMAAQGFCIGYVNGIIEGIRYGLAVPQWASGVESAAEINTLADTILMYCPPETVELGQIVDVVRAYLRDNPAERHKPARLLIHVAMTKSFPCP